MFSDEDMKQAAGHDVLGPAYFDARRVAEEITAKFEAEQFKPLIDKAVDGFRERLWDDVQSFMLSDVEMNVQSHIWRMVDNYVEALLGGNRWAIDRYLLGAGYDHEAIRSAVAKHIPVELQDIRIADLEKEVKSLKERNEALSRSRY